MLTSYLGSLVHKSWKLTKIMPNSLKLLNHYILSNAPQKYVSWPLLKKLDKHDKVPWKETNYRNSVCDLMEEIGLVDMYRLLHPNTKQFTYESKPLCLKSRIDLFLTSNSLRSETKRCEIGPAIAPDH